MPGWLKSFLGKGASSSPKSSKSKASSPAGSVRSPLSSLAITRSLGSFSSPVAQQRRHSEDADDLVERSLRHYDRLPTSSDARALNDLGNDLLGEGDLLGAEPVFRQALAIAESTLGAEHRDTAICLGNVANVLVLKGDLERGEELHRRALGIKEAVLGPDHPGTAATLISLADLLHMKGDAAGAEALYKRALVVKERVLGLQNKSTISTLETLASLAYARGDASAAEEHLRKALAAKVEAFGDRDLGLAASLTCLGNLLCEQGDLQAAEPFMARALAIQTEALGSTHLSTKSCSRSLSSIHRRLVSGSSSIDTSTTTTTDTSTTTATTTSSPLSRGVTVQWLLGLADRVKTDIPDMFHPTTSDVIERIVLPDTEAARCSYAELPSAASDMPSDAPPQFVVCHAWERPFSELISSLQQRFEYAQSTVVWLDFVSLNLHDNSGHVRSNQRQLEALRDSISSVDGVLLVTDPAGSCFLSAAPLYQIFLAAAAPSRSRDDEASGAQGKLEMLPYLLDSDSCPMLTEVLSLLDIQKNFSNPGDSNSSSSSFPEGSAVAAAEERLSAAVTQEMTKDPAVANATVRAAVAEGIAGLVGYVVSAALDHTCSSSACTRIASEMSVILRKEGFPESADLLLSQPDVAELILARDSMTSPSRSPQSASRAA